MLDSKFVFTSTETVNNNINHPQIINMNFDHIISNNTGLVHLIASIIALITGTMVLYNLKGTNYHKKVGYIYTASMTVLLITSFMMYNLYGKFGIFHWFALLSTVSLIGGIVPMLIKKPKDYITTHFSFMYWSVIGLYGALCAEVLVRIPKVIFQDGEILPVFYNLVGVAVFFVMGVGSFMFRKKKIHWATFDK